jgi:hypothetical protein
MEEPMNTIKVSKTRWNLLGVLGWVNLVLAFVALAPALFGYTGYFIWGGVGGLFMGGLLVTIGKPLREVRTIEIPVESE